MLGAVKWYNKLKGFRFLVPDGGGKDVYVHATELKRIGMVDLKEGDRVSFDAVPDRTGHGLKAINVKRAY
jgi:CspA family cold shock protein